jgi:hypothetical protein
MLDLSQRLKNAQRRVVQLARGHSHQMPRYEGTQSSRRSLEDALPNRAPLNPTTPVPA